MLCFWKCVQWPLLWRHFAAPVYRSSSSFTTRLWLVPRYLQTSWHLHANRWQNHKICILNNTRTNLEYQKSSCHLYSGQHVVIAKLKPVWKHKSNQLTGTDVCSWLCSCRCSTRCNLFLCQTLSLVSPFESHILLSLFYVTMVIHNNSFFSGSK